MLLITLVFYFTNIFVFLILSLACWCELCELPFNNSSKFYHVIRDNEIIVRVLTGPEEKFMSSLYFYINYFENNKTACLIQR